MRYLLFLLLLTASASAQIVSAPAVPSIAELRGAFVVCDGHSKYAMGHGPLVGRPVVWDSGFEHCAVLQKAITDYEKTKADGAAIEASKGIAGKLK